MQLVSLSTNSEALGIGIEAESEDWLCLNRHKDCSCLLWLRLSVDYPLVVRWLSVGCPLVVVGCPLVFPLRVVLYN